VTLHGLEDRLHESAIRIALPEPTTTDAAYNQRCWASYFHALASSGAVGVPIPLDASQATIAKLVATCAGVLLPGSPADVNPEKYGEAKIAECAAADPAREAVDELLLQDAFNLHKPIFGICYGMQALNVWRGGTLVQHLPQITGVNHDPGTTILAAHEVQIEAGSKLAAIVEEPGVSIATGFAVNSSHHQAVAWPGDGLRIVARCGEDAGIEAVEGDSSEQFVLGVQWHPERSFDTSESSRRLFHAFVEAAKLYQPRVIAESVA
jgi:putative glutamine amidotransferase